jgi:uncharacterized alpha-E superfamily protein
MWQELNRQYWVLRDAMASGVDEGSVPQTLRGIVSSSYLWDGVADATMFRGEGWFFLKLGKFVERIDGIARLVATRLEAIGASDGSESGENVEWITMLKSLDALDAYRKSHPNRIDRRAVVDFVLFEQDFPRTLRHSTNVASELARRLSRLHPESARPVERDFGRLGARVEYADYESVESHGAAKFLREVIVDVDGASSSLQKTFFSC